MLKPQKKACEFSRKLGAIHPLRWFTRHRNCTSLSRHGCTSCECHQRADGRFTRGRNSCEVHAGSYNCMIADERYLTLLFASGFQHAWTLSNSHPCFGYFGMMIPIHWSLQDHWRLCPLALQHLCRDELRRRVFDKQLEALSVVLCKGAESAVLLCFHNQYYFIIF